VYDLFNHLAPPTCLPPLRVPLIPRASRVARLPTCSTFSPHSRETVDAIITNTKGHASTVLYWNRNRTSIKVQFIYSLWAAISLRNFRKSRFWCWTWQQGR
jgi:hypothetical protein